MSLAMLNLMIGVVEVDRGKFGALARWWRSQRSEGVVHLSLKSDSGVGLREFSSD